jgi:hypothetical protein
VLREWSSVSRIFQHPTRPYLDELDLSRTLEFAAALGDHDEPIMRSPRGSRVIPNRQRFAAVAVLGEREAQLSAGTTSRPGRCRRVVARSRTVGTRGGESAVAALITISRTLLAKSWPRTSGAFA